MKRLHNAKFGYLWVTFAFMFISLIGHWLFGWFAYVDEQSAQHMPVTFGPYLLQMLRDTFENWQSEFLQLIWQVAGLAFLLSVGSPQSKEGQERLEEKVDAILEAVDGENAKQKISALDRKFWRG
jgi:hypothetical protein